MNNKGQVLVIFVILLPIILLLLTIAIDFGLFSIEKKEIDNNTRYATEYYLENIDDIDIENKVKKLLNSNLDDIKIEISNTYNYVEIIVSKKYDAIFSDILNNIIEVRYKGIKETKKVIKG